MSSKTLLGSLFARDYVRKGDLYYQKGLLRKAAEMYLKAERYQQAARIFADAGDLERAAQVLRQAGKPLAAAELLAAQGQVKDAIVAFEEAGAFRQAADLCWEAQQFVRAGRLYENAGMYQRAAESFNRAGEIEHALGAWELEAAQLKRQRSTAPSVVLDEKIRQLDVHRAEILARLGRPLEAGQLLAEHGLTLQAARLFERGKDFAEAARSYLQAERPQEALAALNQAGGAVDPGLKAEVLLQGHRPKEAAELFAAHGKHERAAAAYEAGGFFLEAARFWEQAEADERAAELFLQLGHFDDAGRCFAKAEQHEHAAQAFLRAGHPQSAADAYHAAGKLLLAGKYYAEAGLKTAAQESWEGLGPLNPDYFEASLHLIDLLLTAGQVESAEARLSKLEEVQPVNAEGEVGLKPSARNYWRGRIAEERGNLTAALSLYQKTLAEHASFADASTRWQRLKERTGSWRQPPRVATGTHSHLTSRSATDTQPVVVPAAEATLKRQTPSASVPQSLLPPLSENPAQDEQGMPFDLAERLDPWWDGAEFYRAVDQRDQRVVLLVSFALADIGQGVEEFRRAMGQVRTVDHALILKLEQTILWGDRALLLHTFFAGRPLERRLARGQLPALTALYLLTQLCEGLSAAHQLGLCHQWLSPQTILSDESGGLKIAGFGMREVLAHRDHKSRAYLSPELRAGGVGGPASDVFSLGLLAVELLQAQLPAGWSEAPSLDPTQVSWPEEVEAAVPQKVRQLLIRCLARSPLERPATLELKAALGAVGLLPGQMLAERYLILGELGRGGMSRVYRAEDRELGDKVAIKTVLTPALGHSEEAERLLQEVRICRKITHPNVVRVHDFGRFPGGIFIIMELLEGPGLEQIILQESPLPLRRIRDILREIALALSEAHRLDIVHRDLKPANVILSGDRVKVMDFGIARMGSASTNLTQTGQVVGSPRYMAPEQIQGLPLTGTCDLYALGVLAFTLLAGREPFLGDNTTTIVLKHLHEPPPDVREFRPDLPQPWLDLLSRLLAKKPADRIQSAAELIPWLERLPEG